MLYIKNKENIKGIKILTYTNTNKNKSSYYVEGVYEYQDCYQIHIRSTNTQIIDELLILKRNKAIDLTNHTYNYYTLYDSNWPQRRLNVTKEMINFKDMFIHSIETILQMNN